MDEYLNMTCKYSKCDVQYHACIESVSNGTYKSCACTKEHFMLYQNEVAYSRGMEFPYPEMLAQNVSDGSLPESVLGSKEETEIINKTEIVSDKKSKKETA